MSSQKNYILPKTIGIKSDHVIIIIKILAIFALQSNISMKKRSILLLIALYAFIFSGVAQNGIPKLKWMNDVGAKSFPKNNTTYYVNDFGALGDAMMNGTEAIQKTIDAYSANGGGKVTFQPGIYLSGFIFVKNNINVAVK